MRRLWEARPRADGMAATGLLRKVAIPLTPGLLEWKKCDLKAA
jgi:hypothetical protein